MRKKGEKKINQNKCIEVKWSENIQAIHSARKLKWRWGGGIEKLRKNYINFDVRLNRLSLSPSLQSLRIFISFIPKIIRNSFFFLSLFTYVVVVAGTFFLLRVRLSWTQNVYDLKLFRITENKIYRQWKTECGTKLKKKKN